MRDSVFQTLTPMDRFKGYCSFLYRALQANFTYRSSAFLALLTSIISYCFTILIWRYVYAHPSPRLTISRTAMFVYLPLAFCLNFALTTNIDIRIGQRIRLGLIATDLLKPLDFQFLQMMQALSDAFFNFFLSLGVFIVAVLLLKGNLFPASVEDFLAFLVSVFLAFIIQFSVLFLFIQGIFYTNSSYGISASRLSLHLTFSGISAPLTLYPLILRHIGEWLPFQNIIYVPISIYMGKYHGLALIAALVHQMLWALGMYLLGYWVFKWTLRSIEIQGG
jgi:ABC-type uncharacterized transport system permease subunit